jgi:hypothetical protein
LRANWLGAQGIVIALHQPASEGRRLHDSAAEVGVYPRHQQQVRVFVLEGALHFELQPRIVQVVRHIDPGPLADVLGLIQAATGTLSGQSRLTALMKLFSTSADRAAMAQAGIEIG